MATITVSEIVRAPADRVFATASDIPHAAERITGIDKVEVLSPPSTPLGPGFTWRETRTMMGKQAAETMSITEWDPPRSYTVEATSHGAHYRTPITFDPLPDGSTRVTMTFHATPMTLGARIMMRVFAFMAKHAAKCLQNDLKDIKAACEAGQ